MKRVILLVMDSFGVGESTDAKDFGDVGSNTFGNIAKHCADTSKVFNLPTLERLGLTLAFNEKNGHFPAGFSNEINKEGSVIASYGHAKEISKGKDTTSGHLEMMGVPVLFDWGYIKEFDQVLLDTIYKKNNLPGSLGLCHASGTEIIQRLGQQHIETGKPIFYTSADSVFQIACHEEHFGLEKLYDLCKSVRKEVDDMNISRVIARPFTGNQKDGFKRTKNRHDYAMPPPSKTMLDILVKEGFNTVGIGKIPDIFSHQGISQEVVAHGLRELADKTVEQIKNAPDKSLIFTNFVDFDMEWGHRRDPLGYAKGLESFDPMLRQIVDELTDDDLMIITADHGCDPTFKGSDHTRENVPILVYNKKAKVKNLGELGFSDISETIADYFGIKGTGSGKSFLYKD